MISSFASETARPAIFLSKEIEVLAHGDLLGNLFYCSLQILACDKLLNGDYGSSLKYE